jgi:hypothetical protein
VTTATTTAKSTARGAAKGAAGGPGGAARGAAKGAASGAVQARASSPRRAATGARVRKPPPAPPRRVTRQGRTLTYQPRQQPGAPDGPAPYSYTVPATSYHRWILAEFLFAVVVTVAHPFLAAGGEQSAAQSQAQAQGQPPPSLAMPLVRLTAISLVFFILAFLANGPKIGKVAAAFGLLVDLGIAFNSLPEFGVVQAMFGAAASGPPPTSADNPYPGGISGRPDNYPVVNGLPTSADNPYPGQISGRG